MNGKSMKTFNRDAGRGAIAPEQGLKTKTIIAPVDLLSGPSEALDFAVELAQRWEANLFVMYVYSELPRVSGSKLIHALHSVDWRRYGLSVDLYKLVDRVRRRYPKTFAYFADNDCPAESIEILASELDADLIIISAHDRGWLAKLLLYSDADDIARRSGTPVLVYRSKSREPGSVKQMAGAS
jgi:nucleotide-binding universal stress UspA family protein